jgi:hypothetical protein
VAARADGVDEAVLGDAVRDDAGRPLDGRRLLGDDAMQEGRGPLEIGRDGSWSLAAPSALVDACHGRFAVMWVPRMRG